MYIGWGCGDLGRWVGPELVFRIGVWVFGLNGKVGSGLLVG